MLGAVDLGVTDHGERAGHEQAAQIAVTLFADIAEPVLASTMRCKDCSQLQGYPYKRSHLVALRPAKISTNDPPSTWWPGER
jgi:hypothetical protein